MKQYTDITVLLDRSGSMSSIRGPMESAFDNFIQEHKAVPSTKVTLVQFDDKNDQQVIYQGVPVSSVEKLSLIPRGNTPLLDAMCKLIDNTGERFSEMRETDRPDQVLLVIITDGQENASKQFSRRDVYNRVTRQRDNYKWQFVYLGANQDTFAESQSLGFKWENVLKFSPDPEHVKRAYRSLTANTIAYANAPSYTRGMSGSSCVSSFDADRTSAATVDDLNKDTAPVTSTTGKQ